MSSSKHYDGESGTFDVWKVLVGARIFMFDVIPTHMVSDWTLVLLWPFWRRLAILVLKEAVLVVN